MNPFFLLILAILTPFLLITALLVPPYAGIYAASYIVYSKGAAVNPLATKFEDVFYIIDVYVKLLTHWFGHITTVSIPFYSLPVVLLPLGGIFFALWLTRRLTRKMMDIFHLSAGS